MPKPGVLPTLESKTRERLVSSGHWFNIFRNYQGRTAASCRSAIIIRDRLGTGEHGGVPLWVEMKSEIGAFKALRAGEKVYYAAHTRANTNFNRHRICISLGLNPTEFTYENDPKRGEFFGLVNPLNIDVILKEYFDVTEVAQIFDTSLLIEEGFPTTITTNIGNREYGMEVGARDLIECVGRIFPRTSVAEVSGHEDIWLGRNLKHIDKTREDWRRFPPPTGPKIGILTGNSPESGLTLWNDFLGHYRRLYNDTPDVLMPDVTVHSLPAMGLSMELIQREEAVRAQMELAIQDLLRSGCKLISVACNTTIYFKPNIVELCKEYEAQFVSIADACVEALKYKFGQTQGLEVGLIGIDPVVDLAGGYSGYEQPFREAGIMARGYNASNLAFAVKNIGTDQRRIRSVTERFRRLVDENLADESVIVLSLTEISILYRNHILTAPKRQPRKKKLFIDPLFELARFLVLKYLSAGLRHSKLCNIPTDFPIEDKVAPYLWC